MKKSTIKAEFRSNIEKVWNVVTDNNNFHWRSDLSRIEVIDDNNFIEYTTKGFPTHFTITVKKPLELYEFHMENSNMKGHWTGIFKSIENGCQIEFMEEVSVYNPIMNLFVGVYLKKQQELYIKDLTKALNE